MRTSDPYGYPERFPPDQRQAERKMVLERTPSVLILIQEKGLIQLFFVFALGRSKRGYY